MNFQAGKLNSYSVQGVTMQTRLQKRQVSNTQIGTQVKIRNSENIKAIDRLRQFNQGIQNNQVARKQAGVLCLLFEEDDELKVWLIKRTMSMRQHPGEVAFPGGKRDAVDKDIIDTAKREAFEEIGLPEGYFEVVTLIQPVLSHYKYSVTPVVAQQLEKFDLVLSQKEVDQVFVAPLRMFIEPQFHTFSDYEQDSRKIRIHYFEYQEFKIWGLTAQMLIKIAELAYDCPAQFDVHPPDGVEYWSLYYDEESQQTLIKES